MPAEMPPSSNKDAPDPSNSYERSHPEREGGMGKKNTHQTATPTPAKDGMSKSVKHSQDGAHQINGADALNQRGGAVPDHQPTHSMNDEEPMGSDLAPTDIRDPKNKRHPRTGGKGGTPDAGEPTQKG